MNILSFDDLYFFHVDIGEHTSHGIVRARGDGYADIFGYADLGQVSVSELGARVRSAVAGVNVPAGPAWTKQRAHISGLLALRVDGIYGLGVTFDIRLKRDKRPAISDGCHRGLALCILGEPGLDLARARLAAASWRPAEKEA